MIILMMDSDRVPLLLLQDGPPVRRVPLALARRFFQICTSASAEAVANADLTPLEFAVMAYVNSIDGEPDLDQSALAARLGVDRNSTSLLVGSLDPRLVDAGMLALNAALLVAYVTVHRCRRSRKTTSDQASE